MLDEIDRKILQVLQQDARITMTALAERVGLSATPCTRRVHILEESGVIERYATIVKQDKVGLPINVFVSVTLKEQADAAIENFESQIRNFPQVMECYLMTGGADYLLRVVARDLLDFEEFLKTRLIRIPSILNVRSSFSLTQVVLRTKLPIR